MTKRDLYYQNVGLFKTQNCCDDAIEDIAVSLGVRRSELGLVASSKGTSLYISFLIRTLMLYRTCHWPSQANHERRLCD